MRHCRLPRVVSEITTASHVCSRLLRMALSFPIVCSSCTHALPVQRSYNSTTQLQQYRDKNNAPCNSSTLSKCKGPKGPSIRLTYQHTASRIALVAVDQASLANLSAFVSRLSRCGLNLAWQASSMTPRSWKEGSARVSTRLEKSSRALVSVARNSSGGPAGVRLEKKLEASEV